MTQIQSNTSPHGFPLSKIKDGVGAKRSPYRNSLEHLATRKAISRSRSGTYYPVITPVHIDPDHDGVVT